MNAFRILQGGLCNKAEAGDDYWGTFFQYLREYAEKGDVQKALQYISINLSGLESEDLLNDPSFGTYSPSVMVALNRELARAYRQANEPVAATTHLKRAYTLVTRDDYTHKEKLQQLRIILSELSLVGPLGGLSPQEARDYTAQLARVEKNLGLDSEETKRILGLFDALQQIKIETVSWDNLPPNLMGLTKERVEEIANFFNARVAEGKEDKRKRRHGSKFVKERGLKIGVRVDPPVYVKNIFVTLDVTQPDLSPLYRALLHSSIHKPHEPLTPDISDSHGVTVRHTDLEHAVQNTEPKFQLSALA